MKKILKGIMVLSLCLVTSIGSVKANANPGGGVVNGGIGGDCKIKGMCAWNNDNILILRAIFAYVDNGKIVESYDPFYFVIDDNNYLSGIDSKYIYTADEWGATKIAVNKANKNRYKQASAQLKKFFDDKKEDLNDSDNINFNLKKFIKKSVNTKKKYSNYTWKQVNEKVLQQRESQNANKNIDKAAKRGWRILIEPVLNYTYTGDLPHFWTPKEYAQYFGVDRANSKTTISGITKTGLQWVDIQNIRPITGADYAQSQYFFTTFKDVGIPSPKQNGKWEARRQKCTTISLKKLGSNMTEGSTINHGCGLNIYDVGYDNSDDDQGCYKIDTDIKDVTCKKNDTYNIGSYSTSVEEVDCPKKGKVLNKNKTGEWTKWGVRIAQKNGCSLYVIESGRVKLPGGVTKADTLGSPIVNGGYFAWPAKKDASKGLKLEMQTSFFFRRIGGTKCTKEILEEFYNKGIDYAKTAKYEAELTAGNNKALKESALVPVLQKQKIYRETKFKNGDKKTFRITTIKNLEINSNKNRCQNKGTLAVRDCNGLNLDDLTTDRGEGVISLKREDTPKEGNLTLDKIVLGYNGKFSRYTCKYKIEVQPPCECPPDTYREGENIEDEWKAIGGTCAQVQKMICNKPDYCVYKGKSIDITGCVKEKMKNGKTREEAKTQCTKEKCPNTHTCPNTNYDIPEETWKECLAEEENTETDCEEKLCTNVCYKMNKCDPAAEVEKIDISGCMAKGYSKQTCTQIECESPCCGCKGLCNQWNEKTSSGSGDLHLTGTGTNPNGEPLNCSIDINKCYIRCVKHELGLGENDSIATKLTDSDGRSESDVRTALNKCAQTETCDGKKAPGNGLLKNVMFRTIDLNHPFPGTSGKDKRKPGENWSVESDIKDHITNARGVEGYSLYNQKPLYTIKLTPSTISKIRKYNKNHEYTVIECQKGYNSATGKCVSKFLHSTELTEGVANNIIKNNSVQNCVNLGNNNSKEDYNKCYNIKNN